MEFNKTVLIHDNSERVEIIFHAEWLTSPAAETRGISTLTAANKFISYLWAFSFVMCRNTCTMWVSGETFKLFELFMSAKW